MRALGGREATGVVEDDERPDADEPEEDDAGLGRVLALSDGVFAIAMTLLALDLRIPGVSNEDLPHALAEHGASYLAFLLSFYVVSRYWVNHHRLFRHVMRVDGGLMRLNLLLLLVVAALPFPSSLMSEHGGTTAAVVIYASTLAVASAILGALWLWASSHSLTTVTMPERVAREEAQVSLVITGIFLVSVALAFVIPAEAPFVWLLLVIPRREMLRSSNRILGLFPR